jgi:hypothetical protein
VSVTQDERPPGEYIVDISVAIDVIQIRTFPTLNEARSASYTPKGTHGTIDATWYQAFSLFK